MPNVVTIREAVQRAKADGFELVHCSECQHWDTENCSDGQGWCPKVMGYRTGKWYCAARKGKP